MVKEEKVEDKKEDEEDLLNGLSLNLELEDLHQESKMLVFVSSSSKENASKETNVTTGTQENVNSSNKVDANSVTDVFTNTRVDQLHQHPAVLHRRRVPKVLDQRRVPKVLDRRSKQQKPKLKPKPVKKGSRRRRRKVYWQLQQQL